ncbi:MAG: ABC transporter ATP-binding protein [Candidatus Aminicenantes bacterium]|nr:ABC transporter ATP-binding protein [Candidatus Aminicenantes bacterium]
MKAVEVRDLTKRFGRFTAVDRVSFSVERGEILGFLGPNGAGKTTTIKMILGLLEPSGGRISILGLDVRRKRSDVKKKTGYMSQQFSLYPLLTAPENVEFFAGISGLRRSEIRARRAELEAELGCGLSRLLVRDLPPGIRQKTALFVSLVADPELIFLDEPTSGVDPLARRAFWSTIYGLRERGKTILVTTHNLDEAEYADRILVIHRGTIVLDGRPRALLEERGAASVEQLFREAIRGET